MSEMTLNETQRNELWNFVSFDDLDKYMSKGVKENIERNNMSLKSYIEWRIDNWKDLCRELSGYDIERLEDVLTDSEYIRSYSDMFYSLNASEIRSFIKKRVSELKALEKTTPYEEVWEWHGYIDFYGHTTTIR